MEIELVDEFAIFYGNLKIFINIQFFSALFKDSSLTDDIHEDRNSKPKHDYLYFQMRLVIILACFHDKYRISVEFSYVTSSRSTCSDF